MQDNGMFSYKNLPTGNYVIWATLKLQQEGLVRTFAARRDVHLTDHNVMVDLSLVPAAKLTGTVRPQVPPPAGTPMYVSLRNQSSVARIRSDRRRRNITGCAG
jgi:hypothetical protein